MTTRKNLTRITTFHTNGHSYEICRDEANEFWGFDTAELVDGKLAHEYNGVNGHNSKSMIETMRSCYRAARTANEIDREKLQNFDRDEMMKLMQIVEDSEREIA